MVLDDIAGDSAVKQDTRKYPLFYGPFDDDFQPEEFQPAGYCSIMDFYIEQVMPSLDTGLEGFDFEGLARKLESWDYDSREALLRHVSDDVLLCEAELLDDPAGYERLKQLADTILEGSSFRGLLEKTPEEAKAKLEDEMRHMYDYELGF